MRVLQVDSGREWRGGQNQVRLLCRELAKRPTVALALVTKNRSALAQRALREGVAVEQVRWTIGPDPWVAWRLFKICRRFKPDVVHAHDSHALAVALAALRYWAFEHQGKEGSNRDPTVGGEGPRLVATRRVDFSVRRHGPARWLGQSAWLKADHVIAISQAVKGVLVSDGRSPGEISVVHDGIDPDEVRRNAARPLNIRGRLGLAPGTPLAVNVAALVDHKDQRTLIRAAAAVRTLRPDLHWVIAGEGERRGSLAAEITRLDLAPRVHLLGYIEEADALIGEADVFVMSSKEEGLGSVVLNALALEKPVVATRAGGLPEILPAEVLVPVGDAAALGRMVVERIDRATRLPLPPRFTASAMAEGVLAVYRSLT